MNSTQTTISSQTVIPLHIPTQTQSANHTVVTGTTSAITDANGKTWTITSGGQVAVDSIVDTTTANVTGLAYVNGTIWQENSSRLWWGNAAGTATSPLPATPTLTARVIGSGSDTIVLTMSEDADGPISAAGRDAEFTLNVNGQQIGGLQTVTASLSAGQTQTFRFQGNFAPGQHAVTVTFANKSMTQGDNAAFNDGGDRNIYVNSAAYDAALHAVFAQWEAGARSPVVRSEATHRHRAQPESPSCGQLECGAEKARNVARPFRRPAHMRADTVQRGRFGLSRFRKRRMLHN